jgi:hypothetical protein
VEQGRASPVLVHLHQLARTPSADLRDRHQPHRQHEQPSRPRRPRTTRSSPLSDRQEDLEDGTTKTEYRARRLPWRLELRHQVAPAAAVTGRLRRSQALRATIVLVLVGEGSPLGVLRCPSRPCGPRELSMECRPSAGTARDSRWGRGPLPSEGVPHPERTGLRSAPIDGAFQWETCPASTQRASIWGDRGPRPAAGAPLSDGSRVRDRPSREPDPWESRP